MVFKVNHKRLASIIDIYYGKKKALLVYGRFGIGKSRVFKVQGALIAKKRDRIFVEWNKLTEEEKENVFVNSGKFFVFLDVRLSENDPGDIKGIPFREKDYIVWLTQLYSKLLAKPDSDGILFFDEINLAAQLTISSVYKIIYDREIGESKISDNWLIAGAGNTDEDRAHVHTLAPPVRDRGGEVELLPAIPDDWLEWAAQNGIDSRIIGYISWQKTKLWIVDYKDNQKFTTYRGWERVSDLIKDLGYVGNEELFTLITSSAIGEGVAIDFTAFCKIQELVNLDEILKNLDKLKELKNKLDIKFFVLSSIAERYGTKSFDFEKVIKTTKVLDEMEDPDFVALLWKLCINYDKKRFIEEFTSYDQAKIKKLVDKYAKLIIK